MLETKEKNKRRSQAKTYGGLLTLKQRWNDGKH